jgi:hypothetical protein
VTFSSNVIVRSRTSAKTFKFLQSDIIAVHPRVKKAFFANLAAGMQSLKEAKEVSRDGAALEDQIARQTVLRQLSHAKKMLVEAQTMVPSCPMVNLQCGIAFAETALLKDAPRCDSLFESAYAHFQASLAIWPLDGAYGAYIAALSSHARIKGAHIESEAEAVQLEDRASQLKATQLADERLAGFTW